MKGFTIMMSMAEFSNFNFVKDLDQLLYQLKTRFIDLAVLHVDQFHVNSSVTLFIFYCLSHKLIKAKHSNTSYHDNHSKDIYYNCVMNLKYE